MSVGLLPLLPPSSPSFLLPPSLLSSSNYSPCKDFMCEIPLFFWSFLVYIQHNAFGPHTPKLAQTSTSRARHSRGCPAARMDIGSYFAVHCVEDSLRKFTREVPGG